MHPCEPPRIPLANLPTPLVELRNLAKQIGVERLLMKRDDMTGLETSGNKVRKLEYIVADAIAQGADTLVTNGGFQSNHCRATAAVGARLGMKVHLILRCPEPNPPNDGNLFLDHLFGAEISFHTPDDYNNQRQEIIDRTMAALRAEGRRPYFFPTGGSIPLGCWGYIRCVAELVQQLGKETAVDLFSSVSSSGTHCGLMLGKALLGLSNWRIFGVAVSDSIDYFNKELRGLERATNRQYKLDLDELATPIELVDGFIGGGYAIPTAEAVETTRLVARSEGIVLDPTYTSKGMAGTIATLRGASANRVRPGAVPVFIHTGGVFGLFARRDLFP